MIIISRHPTSVTTRQGIKTSFETSAKFIYDEDAEIKYNYDGINSDVSFNWEYSTDGGDTWNSIATSEHSIQTDTWNVDESGSCLVAAFSKLSLREDFVMPILDNTFFRCMITAPDESVITNTVLMMVISNKEITENIHMEYTSRFTGEEIDAGLRRSLSNLYDESTVPGTRLIGRYSDDPVNLNKVLTPGVYTAHFYTHGPHTLIDVNGTAPIQMTVLNAEDYEGTGEASLFQMITCLAYATEAEENESTGISAGDAMYYMFYRDMNDPTVEIDNASSEDGYGWHKLLLSEGTMTVVNNLSDSSPYKALSANMGRYLKALIDQDNVGGANLLMASSYKMTSTTNGSAFAAQWTQYMSDGASVTNSDSVTGIFIPSVYTYNTNKYAGAANFNPAVFFSLYNNYEYIEINTTDNTYCISPEGFHDDYIYGYRTREAFTPSVIDSDIAFTASFWVTNMMNPATGVLDQNNDYPYVFVDLALLDSQYKRIPVAEITSDTGETYTENGVDINMQETVKSLVETRVRLYDLPYNKAKRISVALKGVDVFIADGKINNYDVAYILMQVGIKGRGIVRLTNFKLERGTIPTDGAITLPEMWNEFDNANYIRTIPVDTGITPSTMVKGQGLVFAANTSYGAQTKPDVIPGKFIKKYLATGGGGGFVISPTEPDEEHREVLWYVHGSTHYTTPLEEDMGDESGGTVPGGGGGVVIPGGGGDTPSGGDVIHDDDSDEYYYNAISGGAIQAGDLTYYSALTNRWYPINVESTTIASTDSRTTAQYEANGGTVGIFAIARTTTTAAEQPIEIAVAKYILEEFNSSGDAEEFAGTNQYTSPFFYQVLNTSSQDAPAVIDVEIASQFDYDKWSTQPLKKVWATTKLNTPNEELTATNPYLAQMTEAYFTKMFPDANTMKDILDGYADVDKVPADEDDDRVSGDDDNTVVTLKDGTKYYTAKCGSDINAGDLVFYSSVDNKWYSVNETTDTGFIKNTTGVIDEYFQILSIAKTSGTEGRHFKVYVTKNVVEEFSSQAAVASFYNIGKYVNAFKYNCETKGSTYIDMDAEKIRFTISNIDTSEFGGTSGVTIKKVWFTTNLNATTNEIKSTNPYLIQAKTKYFDSSEPYNYFLISDTAMESRFNEIMYTGGLVRAFAIADRVNEEPSISNKRYEARMLSKHHTFDIAGRIYNTEGFESLVWYNAEIGGIVYPINPYHNTGFENQSIKEDALIDPDNGFDTNHDFIAMATDTVTTYGDYVEILPLKVVTETPNLAVPNIELCRESQGAYVFYNLKTSRENILCFSNVKSILIDKNGTWPVGVSPIEQLVPMWVWLSADNTISDDALKRSRPIVVFLDPNNSHVYNPFVSRETAVSRINDAVSKYGSVCGLTVTDMGKFIQRGQTDAADNEIKPGDLLVKFHYRWYKVDVQENGLIANASYKEYVPQNYRKGYVEAYDGNTFISIDPDNDFTKPEVKFAIAKGYSSGGYVDICVSDTLHEVPNANDSTHTGLIEPSTLSSYKSGLVRITYPGSDKQLVAKYKAGDLNITGNTPNTFNRLAELVDYTKCPEVQHEYEVYNTDTKEWENETGTCYEVTVTLTIMPMLSNTGSGYNYNEGTFLNTYEIYPNIVDPGYTSSNYVSTRTEVRAISVTFGSSGQMPSGYYGNEKYDELMADSTNQYIFFVEKDARYDVIANPQNYREDPESKMWGRSENSKYDVPYDMFFPFTKKSLQNAISTTTITFVSVPGSPGTQIPQDYKEETYNHKFSGFVSSGYSPIKIPKTQNPNYVPDEPDPEEPAVSPTKDPSLISYSYYGISGEAISAGDLIFQVSYTNKWYRARLGLSQTFPYTEYSDTYVHFAVAETGANSADRFFKVAKIKVVSEEIACSTTDATTLATYQSNLNKVGDAKGKFYFRVRYNDSDKDSGPSSSSTATSIIYEGIDIDNTFPNADDSYISVVYKIWTTTNFNLDDDEIKSSTLPYVIQGHYNIVNDKGFQPNEYYYKMIEYDTGISSGNIAIGDLIMFTSMDNKWRAVKNNTASVNTLSSSYKNKGEVLAYALSPGTSDGSSFELCKVNIEDVSTSSAYPSTSIDEAYRVRISFIEASSLNHSITFEEASAAYDTKFYEVRIAAKLTNVNEITSSMVSRNYLLQLTDDAYSRIISRKLDANFYYRIAANSVIPDPNVNNDYKVKYIGNCDENNVKAGDLIFYIATDDRWVKYTGEAQGIALRKLYKNSTVETDVTIDFDFLAFAGSTPSDGKVEVLPYEAELNALSDSVADTAASSETATQWMLFSDHWQITNTKNGEYTSQYGTFEFRTFNAHVGLIIEDTVTMLDVASSPIHLIGVIDYLKDDTTDYYWWPFINNNQLDERARNGIKYYLRGATKVVDITPQTKTTNLLSNTSNSSNYHTINTSSLLSTSSNNLDSMMSSMVTTRLDAASPLLATVASNEPVADTNSSPFTGGTYTTTTTTTDGKVLTHYEGELYWYDPDMYNTPDNPTGGWVPVLEHYHIGDTPPANPNLLWVDTTNDPESGQVYNEYESPDIKYFDRKYGNRWRILGAEPRPAWVIQDTPPTGENADLMWITTSGILSVPYRKTPTSEPMWLPIQAIWGNND